MTHEKQKSSPMVAVAVLTVFVVVLALLAIGFFRSLPFLDIDNISENEIEARLLPIGHSVLGPPISADGTVAALTPQQIFNKTCIACHGSGVLGAPVFENKSDWAPRISKGLDALVKSALNGIGAMPAKGGNTSLSDEDIRKTVIYMANKSGGNFEE